jgi:hypothetical protein
MLDSSLWRIRVRVSGGPSWIKLKRSAAGSIGVTAATVRLSEFERDWRLLLVVEVEADVEVLVVVEDVDPADWSDFREPFRVAAVGSGVAERLLTLLALRVRWWSLKEVSSSAAVVWVWPSVKSLGSSGVVEGQLESELSSEDLTVGVLAREFDVVVFVERDLEERRGSCIDSVCCGCSGWISSSMTSTTCPSGATTS